MAPNGLKKLLKETTPCKLTGRGAHKRFEVPGDCRFSGLTKRLQSRIFSEGTLPRCAVKSAAPAGGHWRGPDGGRRRGSAVDAQVSRLASASESARRTSRMLNLTRHVFAALNSRGMEPLLGQRAVCSKAHRVATAADVVCFDSTSNCLVIVELKCGHSGSRTAAATESGRKCAMKRPLCKAHDCVLHRHFAQLAATLRLFEGEERTMQKLHGMGIQGVRAKLLYANDQTVDVYDLPNWWAAKAPEILQAVAR